MSILWSVMYEYFSVPLCYMADILQMALFRFDASIHAISTNSYVDDNRAFDTVMSEGFLYWSDCLSKRKDAVYW